MTDDGGKPPRDEFPGNVIFFRPTTKTGRPRGSGGVRKKAAEKRVTIPIVPTGDINIAEIVANAKENTSDRAYAAGILLSRLYPVETVMHMLGFPDAASVYRAVAGRTLMLNKGDQLESLRISLIGALQDQARRSLALASADAFEDAEGNRYPNTERIAWHKEARQDLEALARISGAQAAAQVKLVTPESEELDEIVRQLEIAAGRQVVEADVLVLDVIADENTDTG